MESSTSTSSDSFTTPCYIHNKFEELVTPDCDLKDLTSINELNRITHSRYVQTATAVRELARKLGNAELKLIPKSILIVTKARDNSLVYLTREMAEWLMVVKNITVYVDHKLENSKRFNAKGFINENPHLTPLLKYWDRSLTTSTPNLFDLVITLGGDGTVLYLSSIFQHIVPPVISFNLGSLGFLTNFKFEHFRETLESVLTNGFKVNLRMRFTCTVFRYNGTLVTKQEVLNEIVIDRGPSPWVSMLELYGNDHLLTVVQADGLILSTPTGSTAYSLSAGGSLVHPEVPTISVTPICPHTLSFRPMLLPDSMALRVVAPETSRSTAWASFDGRNRVELHPGDYVQVVASQFPLPTIISSPTEYIDSISRTLKWNVRERQRSFVHLLSKKNKQNYDNVEDYLLNGTDSLDDSDDSDTPDIDGRDSSTYLQRPTKLELESESSNISKTISKLRIDSNMSRGYKSPSSYQSSRSHSYENLSMASPISNSKNNSPSITKYPRQISAVADLSEALGELNDQNSNYLDFIAPSRRDNNTMNKTSSDKITNNRNPNALNDKRGPKRHDDHRSLLQSLNTSHRVPPSHRKPVEYDIVESRVPTRKNSMLKLTPSKV